MQAFYYSLGVYNFTDYYPFGMVMPGRSFTSENYRFGFNGMEKDGEEWTGSEGSHLDFGARIYDSRLGRFLSTDPWEYKYSSWSTYLFAGNNPIRFIDIEGKGVGDGPFSKSSYMDNGKVIVVRVTTSDRIAMETVQAFAENIPGLGGTISMATSVSVNAYLGDPTSALENGGEYAIEKGLEKGAYKEVVEVVDDIDPQRYWNNYGSTTVTTKTTKLVKPSLLKFSSKIPILGAGIDAYKIMKNSGPTRSETLQDFTFKIAAAGSFDAGYGYENISNKSLFVVNPNLTTDMEQAETLMNDLYNSIDILLPANNFDLTTDEGISDAWNFLIMSGGDKILSDTYYNITQPKNTSSDESSAN